VGRVLVTNASQEAGAQGFSASRQILVAAATVCLLAGLFFGLYVWRTARGGTGAMGPSGQPVAVSAYLVEAQAVPEWLEAIGSIRAAREVRLAPEVSGRVTDIRFEAGMKVNEGDLLIRMFDAPGRADLAAAQARMQFAQLQYLRAEELARTGVEAQELMEQRRAERDEAKAVIQQIEARLTQKQLRAPFAGQLGIRRVNLGQYLNPGDTVGTLTALDRVHVDFSLPQQDLGRVSAGADVQILTDAYPDQRFLAQVTALEPQIDTDTRNVTIQATLDNPGGLLRSGMYVTVRLILPTRPDSILVPATAVQPSAQGDTAIAIRGDQPQVRGTAQPVSVVTGRRIGNGIIVEEGLRAGDVIVAEGQLRLQPGASVEVTQLMQAGGG
jgi:multidrug efflux system membrane fusion protein